MLLIGFEIEFWKNLLDVRSEFEDHACEERKIWGCEAPSGKFLTVCLLGRETTQIE
jgi:hypothetical protein